MVAAEARFTASLDRDSVVLGEAVSLTLKFEGGAPKGLPGIPQIAGLQIGPGVSRSVNTSLGPDRVLSSVESYVLTVLPQQAGEFVIPALSAEVDGRNLQSQPLKLKVLQSDTSAPPAEYASKLAFLWMVVPKRAMYVGEVLVAEMRLYVRGDVRNISEVQIPPFGGEGFTSSKFIEGQRFQRPVGNVPFTIIPLKIALTPVKTGLLPVGPVKGSLVVHLLPNQNRQRDLLENFFGPQTVPQKVELSLDDQKMDVLPLPAEGAPANFSGIVGKYTMSCTAGPTNVGAGDPITVKIQISGKGQLDALNIPEESGWRDFKVYPPTSRVEPSDALGVEGTKYFEQVVVPQNADVKELPPLVLNYFDPEQKSYRTLTEPAVPLVVRPSGSTPTPTIVTANPNGQEATPAQDIVHIKPRLGALAQIGPPLIQQAWFLGLQVVPVAALLSAVAWRKRADKLANNPRLRRQRQVAQITGQGIAELRQFAAQNQAEQFFATLFRLLQEQLGERLDLPASSITEAVIDEHLRQRGVGEQTLATLQTLFAACNFARYAPVKTPQELQAMIPQFEAAVGDLQALAL